VTVHGGEQISADFSAAACDEFLISTMMNPLQTTNRRETSKSLWLPAVMS